MYIIPPGQDLPQLIVAVYEQSTKLQSLCGLRAGVKSVDLSKKGLEVADVVLLASELKKGLTTRSLRTLNLANNSVCGVSLGGTVNYCGMQALGEALKAQPNASLETLNLKGKTDRWEST